MRVNTCFFYRWGDGPSVVTLIGSECSANMLKLLTGIVAEMNVCRVDVAYALAINIAMLPYAAPALIFMMKLLLLVT